MLFEQACDAVVLSRGHDAERYALVLLRFARAATAAGGRVAPLGTAVTGAGLPTRLDLLHAPSAPAVSAHRTVCATLAYVTIVAICAAATPTRAQSPADGGGQPAASWGTYTSEHFEILHTTDQQHRLEDVAREAEQAYACLAAALEHELAQPVSLILVGRNQDLRDGVAAAQELGRRGAARRQRIVMSIETLDTRTAPSFTSSRISSRSRSCPIRAARRHG